MDLMFSPLLQPLAHLYTHHLTSLLKKLNHFATRPSINNHRKKGGIRGKKARETSLVIKVYNCGVRKGSVEQRLLHVKRVEITVVKTIKYLPELFTRFVIKKCFNLCLLF